MLIDPLGMTDWGDGWHREGRRMAAPILRLSPVGHAGSNTAKTP